MDLPTLEEQRRIADFLDAETTRIDRMGSLQEELRRRLDERAGALLDLAIDDLMSRFGTLPLRRFILGVDQGMSPQCDAIPANVDEWGVLKVSCLRPRAFLPAENKRLPNGIQPDTRHEINEGDLLVTRANSPELVGSTAVVPRVRRRLLLSDKIFRIRTTPDVDPRYVAVVASGSRVRAICAASSNGASQSMANIRFEEVKAWPIPPASPTDQAEIVSRVESSQRTVGQLRAKIGSQLELLAERRQALITAAVTGEFDVSSASGKGVTN
jgi:type I restriction enzyme S subunit